VKPRIGSLINGMFTTASIAGAAVLLAAIGCSSQAPKPAPIRSSATSPPTQQASNEIDVGPVHRGEYAGNAACVPCHKAECAAHSGSNHAKTLRIMEPSKMNGLVPATSDLPDTFFTFAVRKDGYFIQEGSSQDQSRKLEYAFGSGKHGVTFVSLGKDEKLFEMRSSYFPHEKRWGATPGLETMPPANSGLTFSEKASRACFSCHTNTLPESTSRPETTALGVGCESCHGGGGEHIKLMQVATNREADIKIPRLKTASALEVDTLCIRCHQTTPVSNPFDSSLTMTARFAPGDIEKSACFKANNSYLSCAKCHDPHTNATSDKHVYEKVCLSCHSTSSAGTGFVKGKTCPVSSSTGCIPCHMKSTRVLPGTSAISSVPDHFIRIHKPGESGT
jgi:Cytochrome c554 and c-prime